MVKDKLTADRLDWGRVSGRARWAEILFLFYMHCEWCSIIMVLYTQRASRLSKRSASHPVHLLDGRRVSGRARRPQILFLF